MKKYTVNVHYEVVLSVVVMAENEKSAYRLASNKASVMSLNDGDVIAENSCITDIEDI